ncbi:MAG: formyl transferase [Ponticaulis sp.]|nr:formyl transferase [Ponticaulis sp.]
MSAQFPIVAMAADGPHTWIMINALRKEFGDFPIILEEGEPANTFWKRRMKMLGPIKVASMQAARIPIKLTKGRTQQVIDDMIAEHELNPNMPDAEHIVRVPSPNSQPAREALMKFNPKAVFVINSRMIGKKTLNAIDAPFINYHSGINPAYRGMYGGYFALANGEPEHFGATVHLVDEGVDTGDILYQSQVHTKPGDNFHTYIWRIASGSREIVVRAMQDAVNGTLAPHKRELPSRQYFAPTFGGYLWNGLVKGIW